MARQEIEFNGVTRRPDDSQCGNGELECAMNCAHDGGGLRPIERPRAVFRLQGGERVLCIHETAAYKHYIIATDTVLRWCGEDGERTALAPITATDAVVMGNTIIASTPQGLRYLLWQDGSYKVLEQEPPRLKITFGLDTELRPWPMYKDEDNPKSGKADQLDIQARIKESSAYSMSYGDTEDNSWVPPLRYIDDADKHHTGFKAYATHSFKSNATDEAEAFKADISMRVLAQVNKFIQDRATGKNKFMFPFFVRYAYELYDGTLCGHSDPVLMMPSSRAPVFVCNGYKGFALNHTSVDGDGYVYVTFRGRVWAFVSSLRAQLLNTPDLSDWRDLVKGVNIYVTAPIYTYDQGGQVLGWRNVEDGWNFASHYSIGRVSAVDKAYRKVSFLDAFRTYVRPQGDKSAYYEQYGKSATLGGEGTGPYYVVDLPTKTDADVMSLLRDCGPFYKIASIEAEKIKAGPDAELKIDDGVLNTLTSREVMADGWHSGDTLKAGCMAVYNHRLNLGAVTRSRHLPYSPALAWARYDGDREWTQAVTIKDGGTAVTLGGESGSNGAACPLFAYYGDTAATELLLHSDLGLIRLPLKEHPSLNGSYYLADIYKSPPTPTGEPLPDSVTESLSREVSKVYTSDADNPFHFTPERINPVGDDEIRYLVPAVTALSQGQFGAYPLYAFTAQGVWSLKVSGSGGWESIQPVARDVALCRPCQVDGAVVYATARGVMQLQGSTTELLSLPLDGVVRLARLRDYEVSAAAGVALNAGAWIFNPESVRCIGYDYRHARIYAVCGDESAWVYNIKGGCWTQAQRGFYALNSYPALEIVSDNEVMTYECDDCEPLMRIITRPLKLAAGLQKVRELAVRGIADGARVACCLFGSRDWRTYEPVASSHSGRITRLGGSGYIAHAVEVLITTAGDGTSIRGVTLDAMPSADNKIR